MTGPLFRTESLVQWEENMNAAPCTHADWAPASSIQGPAQPAHSQERDPRKCRAAQAPTVAEGATPSFQGPLPIITPAPGTAGLCPSGRSLVASTLMSKLNISLQVVITVLASVFAAAAGAGVGQHSAS